MQVHRLYLCSCLAPSGFSATCHECVQNAHREHVSKEQIGSENISILKTHTREADGGPVPGGGEPRPGGHKCGRAGPDKDPQKSPPPPSFSLLSFSPSKKYAFVSAPCPAPPLVLRHTQGLDPPVWKSHTPQAVTREDLSEPNSAPGGGGGGTPTRPPRGSAGLPAGAAAASHWLCRSSYI